VSVAALVREAWQQRAACRGPDTWLFFPPNHFERKDEKEAREARAKAVCRTCPVRVECLDYALRIREPYGIWGGLSEDERALLLGVQQLRHPAARQPHRRPVPNGEDRLREDGRSLVSQTRDRPGSAHLS
jgi:WhiB family redox-sensing transcriptional regulator